MSRLTAFGATNLAAVAIMMMLFIMNENNSPLVRWGAFAIATAAVSGLALAYATLARNRPGDQP
jgi:amino acid transporter